MDTAENFKNFVINFIIPLKKLIKFYPKHQKFSNQFSLHQPNFTHYSTLYLSHIYIRHLSPYIKLYYLCFPSYIIHIYSITLSVSFSLKFIFSEFMRHMKGCKWSSKMFYCATHPMYDKHYYRPQLEVCLCTNFNGNFIVVSHRFGFMYVGMGEVLIKWRKKHKYTYAEFFRTHTFKKLYHSAEFTFEILKILSISQNPCQKPHHNPFTIFSPLSSLP